MKKKVILFAIFLMTIFITKASAHDVYNIGDYVFFDPVSNKTCDESNYWTIYNQDTTCYRFFVINAHDNLNEEKIKVIMDHDIAFGTFSEYKTKLTTATKNWKRFTGAIDIIDEDTVAEIMFLDDNPKRPRPNLDKKTSTGAYFNHFLTNTIYYQNGELKNKRGFWTKDVYAADKNYAYIINEYGRNSLDKVNSTLGIRPVINIDKSLLKILSSEINISNDLDLLSKYHYQNDNKHNGIYGEKNLTYQHLQGFTITKDKLVFAAFNGDDRAHAVLFNYSAPDYKTLNSDNVEPIGHGNGMTYNKNTDEILIIGCSNACNKIIIYDNKTMQYKRTVELKYDTDIKCNTEDATDEYKNNVKVYNTNIKATNITYTAIGYDEINDLYVVSGYRRMFILDKDFNVKYSFDITLLGGYQDLEYKNGYIYFASSEIYDKVEDKSKICNDAQLYCIKDKFSSVVYVYNAKLNSDGTPTKDFGKLEKRMYIDKAGKFGELEDVSFTDDYMVVGFAQKTTTKDYTYRFYKIPYSKISNNELPINVSTQKDENSLTYNFTSPSELKDIEGFELSSDKKTLSIKLTENTDKTIQICDRYNNCSEQKISFEAKKVSNKDNNQNDNPHTGAFVSVIALIGFILILIIILLLSKKYRRISRL